MTYQEIKKSPTEKCIACGSDTCILYQDLEDNLYNAQGRWGILRCINTKCGLFQLTPKPNDQEIKSFYTEYYTHDNKTGNEKINELLEKSSNYYIHKKYGYKLDNHEFLPKLITTLLYLHPVRLAKFDAQVMALAAPKNNNRLLEIGCGNGKTLERLSKLGWDVEGLEIDPKSIENITRRGLSARSGTLLDQNYPTSSFDVIISSHVIEHIPNPLETLKECYRILKPGGKLHFYTPNSASIGHSIFKHHWRGLEVPRHMYVYTCSSLKQLALNAGFEESVCAGTNSGQGIFFASFLLSLKARSDKSKLIVVNRVIIETSLYTTWLLCKLFGKKV